MRKKRLSWLAAAAMLAATAVAARADDVPGVYATGVDDAGNVLAVGSTDPHWQIVSVPAESSFPAPSGAIVASPRVGFLSNDAPGTQGSSWIADVSSLNSGSVAGYFEFRTTFDLTGFDPSTAVLSGLVAVDNRVVQVSLNGTQFGYFGGVRNDWTALELTSAFEDGENELVLTVHNFDPGPMGLRVELGVTADLVPTEISAVLDVRPDEDDDHLNPGSNGKLPVAIFGSGSLDVSEIDLSTVRFGGASIATSGKNDELKASIEDVDGDGVDDLLVQFVSSDIEIPDDAGDTVVLGFSALTNDGVEIVGSAEVRLNGSKGKGKSKSESKKAKKAKKKGKKA